MMNFVLKMMDFFFSAEVLPEVMEALEVSLDL